MNPQDNPHFTAYALGELSAEEARELHQMLASTPAAAHELEQIEAVTDALRHGAPIPQDRLTHEQRHAVLHPSNLPRLIQPMRPRQPAKRPQPVLWPVLGTALKTAAMVALSGAAFLAGWSVSPKASPGIDTASSFPQIPAGSKEETSSSPSDSVSRSGGATEAVAATTFAGATEAKTTANVASESEVPSSPVMPVVDRQEVQVVAVPPTAEVTKAPQAAPKTSDSTPKVAAAAPERPLDLGFAMATGLGAFASTTKEATGQYNLQPGLLRPSPPKSKGQNFASPLPVAAIKPEPKAGKVSEIYIHSWQSEVATCPWNPAHRLLRVVIQLPADQPAVIHDDASFPIQVNFDAGNVKQYRMLCERHLAAAELRRAGTHVLWYEFQPNGDLGVGRERQIATVTLPGMRFTSQTVGPFDSRKLQVIDRGFSLQNAREEFLFEASVVGFGMLLRGADQAGALNHDLVLDLAKKSKGADVTGERARFIRVVQDAQRIAGL